MAKLIALYKKPADTEKFDAYYRDTHIPLAKTIPGLTNYEISTSSIATPEGQAPYYLIAMLSFESLSAINEGLQSPQGQATAADLANFADAGVDLIFFDDEKV
ncbi:EthD family reductase [Georhizobium sp. MAB10]|uniref:EthD family reductase n=1 Tax=Georhizobium sp. MAB10 TaxID=3028319 RepID=UPI003855D2AE